MFLISTLLSVHRLIRPLNYIVFGLSLKNNKHSVPKLETLTLTDMTCVLGFGAV